MAVKAGVDSVKVGVDSEADLVVCGTGLQHSRRSNQRSGTRGTQNSGPQMARPEEHALWEEIAAALGNSSLLTRV